MLPVYNGRKLVELLNCEAVLHLQKEETIMAISKAKKARQKLSQRGLLTPESLRGSWQGVNPSMKRTPTLLEKRTKLNKKHRRNHANYSDDSFYFLKCRYDHEKQLVENRCKSELISYDQKGLFHRSSTLWNAPFYVCQSSKSQACQRTSNQPIYRPSNDPL
jgi:hypothetical protein